MARPAHRYPTEHELEILKALWAGGPLSAREVLQALPGERAYTSVVTILNIMVDKGYLTRKRQGRGFIYRAKLTENSARTSMMRDMVRRLFGGSTKQAMLHLLDESQVDAGELDELRKELERKRRETS